jgi:hypothetical protein
LPFIGEPSLGTAVALFCAATVAIVLAGTRLTGVADVLAERNGLGEAVMGAVLLGGSTSLSGIVTSVTAASNGSAELAVSNAVGGIAVQTVFLAVADLAYRGVKPGARGSLPGQPGARSVAGHAARRAAPGLLGTGGEPARRTPCDASAASQLRLRTQGSLRRTSRPHVGREEDSGDAG